MGFSRQKGDKRNLKLSSGLLSLFRKLSHQGATRKGKGKLGVLEKAIGYVIPGIFFN